MNRLKRERGIHTPGPGRPKIAERFKQQIAATEKAFASSMPDVAREYVDALSEADPERCPHHHEILVCPHEECSQSSERRSFNHAAAAYAFDRIMGRPTQRTEQTLTLRFVQQLTAAIVEIFVEVNELTDPAARRALFGERCLALRDGVGGGAS